MKKQLYIYKVAFDYPPLKDEERTEFFFTSLAAIYEIFTKEQVGCGVGHLYNLAISDGNIYCGKKATITRELLTSKPNSPKAD